MSASGLRRSARVQAQAAKKPAEKLPAALLRESARREVRPRPSQLLESTEQTRRVPPARNPQDLSRRVSKRKVPNPSRKTVVPKRVQSRKHPTNEARKIHLPTPTPLTSEALRQLDIETQATQRKNHSPEMTSTNTGVTGKSGRSNSRRTTLYHSKMLDELDRRGILDQGYPGERPKNYAEIQRAIEKPRSSPPPTEEEYISYSSQVLGSNNEAAITGPFRSFFGLDTGSRLRPGHATESDQRWKDHEHICGDDESIEVKIAPKPDYAEGLRLIGIPRWICTDLGGRAVPSTRLAFPNFLAELKRDGSMYVAHTELRHYGSVAAQAYHSYYAQILNEPESSWDVARVGSIIFNGLVLEGLVHWVSKSGGDGTKPGDKRYHMTRIIGHFASGPNFEDFELARRQARNFRDYFETIRQEHLQQVQQQPHRPASQVLPDPAQTIPPPRPLSLQDTASVHEDDRNSDGSSAPEEWMPSTTQRGRGEILRGKGKSKRRSAEARAVGPPKRTKTNLSQQIDSVDLDT